MFSLLGIRFEVALGLGLGFVRVQCFEDVSGSGLGFRGSLKFGVCF